MFFDFSLLFATAVLHPWVGWGVHLLLGVAFILALMRFMLGPDTTDRVVALDLLAGIILCYTLYRAIELDDLNFMSVSFAVAVIAFLGTVSIARHLESNSNAADAQQPSSDSASDQQSTNLKQ